MNDCKKEYSQICEFTNNFLMVGMYPVEPDCDGVTIEFPDFVFHPALFHGSPPLPGSGP